MKVQGSIQKWEGKPCIVHMKWCGNVLIDPNSMHENNAFSYYTCKTFTFEDKLTGVVFDLIIGYLIDTLYKLINSFEMRCAIWYQSLFGVFTIVQTHVNACSSLFLPPCRFYLFV